MPTGSFTPGVAADSGLSSTDDNYFEAASQSYVGVVYGKHYNFFCRFPNISAPAGCTITTATLTLKSHQNTSPTDWLVKISASDEDNAAAPTSVATYNGKTSTTAQVDWDVTSGTWNDGVDKTSPSIVTVIQEIIDRGLWAGGQAILLLLKEDGGSEYVIIRNDDGSGNAPFYATLYLEWTGSGSIYNETITESVAVTTSDVGTQTAYTTEITESFAHADSNVQLQTADILDRADVTDYVEVIVNSSLIGVIVEVSLPSLSATGQTNESAALSESIPLLTATGLTGTIASINLPLFTADGTGIIGSTANLSITLPIITCTTLGYGGRVGNLSQTLPSLSLSVTVYDTPVGALAVSLPAFMCDTIAHSAGRFDSYTLKYTRS